MFKGKWQYSRPQELWGLRYSSDLAEYSAHLAGKETLVTFGYIGRMRIMIVEEPPKTTALEVKVIAAHSGLQLNTNRIHMIESLSQAKKTKLTARKIKKNTISHTTT